MLAVLSSLLEGSSRVTFSRTGTSRDDSRRYREAVVSSLEGLQRAAKLANVLGNLFEPNFELILVEYF